MAFTARAAVGQSQAAVGQASMRLFNHRNARFVEQPAGRQTTKPAGRQAKKLVVRQVAHDTAQCALYMFSVKQHGWARGLGKPITEEHARHLSGYLRFSRKNKAGHWTRVEILNARGQLENSNMSTYLLNPFYDGDADNTDPAWVEKLKTVVRWEFVGDESGRHCIRENAFDAEGNLVYSYIPIPVGENRYMGHYVDAWGRPARFRGSKGAQFVIVQWDENGYEAEISYIGKGGFPQPGIWGEYMTRQEHDKNGFVTRKMSCAPDGSFMIDASGNSGQITISDDYGNELITTNVDVLGRAIKIPGNQDEAEFIQRRMAYDKWKRVQRVTYHLADGTPDTTSTGVHGYEISYNDLGQLTIVRHFDLKGRPRNISDWCSVRRDYDRWGNNIFYELTDQNGHFVNNSGNFCLLMSRFERDVCIEEKTYQTTNGSDTLLASHMMRDGNIRTYKYPIADECDTYIEDEGGEVIEKICSHLDGTPKTNRDWGYHRFVNHKTYVPGVCAEDKQWLDTTGHLVAVPDSAFGQDYNHEVIVSDTLRHLLTTKRLIGDRIIFQVEQSRTDDFSVPLGQNGMDIMGRCARTSLEDLMYYKCYVGQARTSKGYGCICIINEYGEPAYARGDDWSWNDIFSFRELGDVDVDRDEAGKAITGENFGSKLPRAYIVEVYDSIAQRYGIRSGDVVMQYGTWSYPAPNAADSVDRQLRMATFSLRDVAKSMVVMRYNPATNSSDVITIKLGSGMPHDFGFFVHAFPYTSTEAQRYQRLYSSHFAQHASDTLAITGTTQSHAVATFMRPFRVQGHKQNVFGRGVVDDAIVLAVVAVESDGKVHSRGVADSICIKTGRYYDYDGDYDYCRRLWFTTDMKTVRSLDFKPGEWTEAEFWQANIDERVSVPCRPLYDQTRRLMDAYVDSLKQARRDSLVRLYGAAADAVVNDSICMIIADVEGDTGYMVKNGYQGRFVILEWCGWKCTDTFEAFKRVFEQNKDKKKDILLLSVGDNGLEEFIRVKTKEKFMGLRIRSVVFSFDVFKLVYDKYSEFCEQNE